jgi:hypothetical protein
MSNKKKSDFSPHISPEKASQCTIPGCMELGTYKAPKSREALDQYDWYCLEHIRQHNEKWNYFAGLGEGEIEYFIRDSVTGHRPTWSRESRVREQYYKLHDALYEFLSGTRKAAPPTPPLNGKLRKALATMDIEYPYTEQELKMQYRSMVKKHHPDMNKGDKKSEEIFKQVTAAYNLLSQHIKTA